MAGDFERWLYRGGQPNRLARILNWIAGVLGAWGLFPGRMVRLETKGRKTGKISSLPVVIAKVDGERYLVSMLGDDVNWVRNVRSANGKAVLQERRRAVVRLDEVDIGQRAHILKAYLLVAPGARPHIPVDKDAPIADFESIAAGLPVFRISVP